MNQFLLAIAENTRTTIFQHHHHHYRDHHHLHPFNPTHNCHRPLPWRGPEQPGGRTLHLLGCRLAGLIKRNPTSSFKSLEKSISSHIFCSKNISSEMGHCGQEHCEPPLWPLPGHCVSIFYLRKMPSRLTLLCIPTTKETFMAPSSFFAWASRFLPPLFLVVFLRSDLPANLNLDNFVFVV